MKDSNHLKQIDAEILSKFSVFEKQKPTQHLKVTRQTKIGHEMVDDTPAKTAR